MTGHSPFGDYGDAYVVRAPRKGDAVGTLLRQIFEFEPRLPADLSALLRQLDTRGR